MVSSRVIPTVKGFMEFFGPFFSFSFASLMRPWKSNLTLSIFFMWCQIKNRVRAPSVPASPSQSHFLSRLLGQKGFVKVTCLSTCFFHDAIWCNPDRPSANQISWNFTIKWHRIFLSIIDRYFWGKSRFNKKTRLSSLVRTLNGSSQH